MRVAAYVDGFNLYYRALRNTPYKWINIHKLCASLVGSDQTHEFTKYFTARVSPRAGDLDAPRRQQLYFSALKTEPDLYIHYGRFISKTKRRPLVGDSKSYVEIHDTEEKGSDVNLAAHLLNDAWKDVYDIALVLSQDTDLCEPMRIVSQELKKKIGLIVLDGRKASERLRAVSTFVRHVQKRNLVEAQFPDSIRLPSGKILTKPESW